MSGPAHDHTHTPETLVSRDARTGSGLLGGVIKLRRWCHDPDHAVSLVMTTWPPGRDTSTQTLVVSRADIQALLDAYPEDAP